MVPPAPPNGLRWPPVGTQGPAPEDRVEICSVSAEIAPFSKTGGLGDVAAALPRALAAQGHRVLAVAPRYRPYSEAWDTSLRLRFPLFGRVHTARIFHTRAPGFDLAFVDHPALCRGGIYGDERGTYGDNLFRYALLCRAAIELSRRLPVAGQALADAGPVRFLTHDWHAGLLPVYLDAHYRSQGLLTDSRVVHVIHNLAHQGRFGFDQFAGLDLAAHHAPGLDMGGAMNLMKAALVKAERVVAVSPTYAREICHPDQGFGLDPILRARGGALTGVLNGIDGDEWSPATDGHLPATYGPDALGAGPTPGPAGGRARCKAALLRELGVADPDAGADNRTPLFGFIGRLTGQKGIDLLDATTPWLVQNGAKVVFLGTGERRWEGALRALQRRFPGRVAAHIGFDVGLAHRITAGADALLMPSRFEPCGLNQLYALAYGTVPVVHATGGLADTVHSFDPWHDRGNGWAFAPARPSRMQDALAHALHTWHHHPESWRAMARRGMAEDHSWDASARTYAALLAG